MSQLDLQSVITVIAIGLVVMLTLAIVLGVVSDKVKRSRGAMSASDLEIEVEALLGILYHSSMRSEQTIRVTHKRWSQRRRLSRDEEYVVVKEAVARNQVEAVWGQDFDGKVVFWACRLLALRPPSIRLVAREYDERVVAAGVGRAQISPAPASISDSDLLLIAHALERDKIYAVAAEIEESVQHQEKKKAFDTALKVIGLVADSATLWGTTRDLIAQLF